MRHMKTGCSELWCPCKLSCHVTHISTIRKWLSSASPEELETIWTRETVRSLPETMTRRGLKRAFTTALPFASGNRAGAGLSDLATKLISFPSTYEMQSDISASQFKLTMECIRGESAMHRRRRCGTIVPQRTSTSLWIRELIEFHVVKCSAAHVPDRSS